MLNSQIQWLKTVVGFSQLATCTKWLQMSPRSLWSNDTNEFNAKHTFLLQHSPKSGSCHNFFSSTIL